MENTDSIDLLNKMIDQAHAIKREAADLEGRCDISIDDRQQRRRQLREELNALAENANELIHDLPSSMRPSGWPISLKQAPSYFLAARSPPSLPDPRPVQPRDYSH